MFFKRTFEVNLPTPWGNFCLIGFEEVLTGYNHIALIYGNIINYSVLVRIHSECLTGDIFFSLRCDCGFQLEASLNYIVQYGSGVLFYHRQEGRNIGLFNKLFSYYYQDNNIDTIESNYKLGFLKDERCFFLFKFIFKILNVNKVFLLTNNPQKAKILFKIGLNIIEILPLILGRNANNFFYLDSKIKKMNHVNYFI